MHGTNTSSLKLSTGLELNFYTIMAVYIRITILFKKLKLSRCPYVLNKVWKITWPSFHTHCCVSHTSSLWLHCNTSRRQASQTPGQAEPSSSLHLLLRWQMTWPAATQSRQARGSEITSILSAVGRSGGRTTGICSMCVWTLIASVLIPSEAKLGLVFPQMCLNTFKSSHSNIRTSNCCRIVFLNINNF